MARNEKNTRMCASCRTRRSRSEFIRVAKSKDGEIKILKNNEVFEGRSTYICPTKKCVEGAIRKNALPRNLKAEIPPYIYEELKEIAKTLVQE